MKHLRNLNLGARFVMMVIVILSMTMGVATFFSSQAQRTQSLESLAVKGEALGNFVALISPPVILSYDFEGMTDLVREVTKEEDVVFAVLIAENGISLTNYLDPENSIVVEALAFGSSNNVLETVETILGRSDLIGMKFPVLFQGDEIATLSLGLSRVRIDRNFNETLIRLSLTNLAIIIFLSICIYFAFRVIVMRRIDRLNLGLQHVGAGNLNYRVRTDLNDEIGSLQRSFNEMESKLKETIKEKDTYAGQLQQQAEEMKRLRDNALRANKHKTEFLANMSHELRTPLNAIIGFSEVLKERMFGELNEKQEEYIQDIHSSGRHLLSLINDILDLSKVEAGRMELIVSKFNLKQAVLNSLVLIKERATRHSVGVESEIDADLGEYLGDERKFKQIMLNLLSNAIKFTPDGGLIKVVAIKTNAEIVVSIQDNGIGIAEHEHAKIFEEFIQAEAPTSGNQEGTGLGLSLTKSFVEMHKGRIWVESSPGKGSTFTFTLPI